MSDSTEREKMLRGELYDPLDAELVAARRRARHLCFAFNATRDEEQQERRRLLNQLLGGKEKVWIEPPFFVDYGTHITVGKNVFFNFNCVVLDVCRVTIGDYTKFGPNVQIYTATHPLSGVERRKGLELGKPIAIGSDVWVGGSAIICPGVTIGDGAVVGAGAVVTRDVAPRTFVAGNPARLVREIGE